MLACVTLKWISSVKQKPFSTSCGFSETLFKFTRPLCVCVWHTVCVYHLDRCKTSSSCRGWMHGLAVIHQRRHCLSMVIWRRGAFVTYLPIDVLFLQWRPAKPRTGVKNFKFNTVGLFGCGNTGYGDGSFFIPCLVTSLIHSGQVNRIVFARPMHTTPKFAMTVLSKCVSVCICCRVGAGVLYHLYLSDTVDDLHWSFIDINCSLCTLFQHSCLFLENVLDITGKKNELSRQETPNSVGGQKDTRLVVVMTYQSTHMGAHI